LNDDAEARHFARQFHEGYPGMNDFCCITSDVKLGKDVRLSKFINLSGCTIGDGSKIR